MIQPAVFRCAARVERVARLQQASAKQPEQRAVVVSIFSKCGIVHSAIDAVAAEAAAELVVDAALAHASQSELRHRAGALAQAELEVEGMREFGRAAETAEMRIEVARRVSSIARIGSAESAARCPPGCGHPCARAAFALRRSGLRSRGVSPPRAGDALAELRETRQAVARLLRKIRAAKKGVPSGERNIVSGQPPVRCDSI